MDISACSSLLHSRYGGCVPLVNPACRRGRNVHGCRQHDIAYLSSVQAPSELCLGLACLAWPRGLVVRDEHEWLLVFVPFDEPRDEIFVEIPIAAFVNFSVVSTGNRMRGLHLLPLNDYSLLCSHDRDGIPPRKGLFVTFRSREAQQRFLDALKRAIYICGRNKSFNGNSPSLLGKGLSPDTEGRNDKGGGEKRGEETGMTEEVVSRAADMQSWSAVGPLRDGGGAHGVVSFIDSLLAERDRRRAAYMYDSVCDGSPPSGDIPVSGSSFGAWAQRHRDYHPWTWNMLAGAAERQLGTESQALGNDVATDVGVRQGLGMHPTQENIPSLEQREALLREVRVAMEVLDNMNEAGGGCSMSLIGASRDLVRQHQEDLWRFLREEKGATTRQPHLSTSDEVLDGGGGALSPAPESRPQMLSLPGRPQNQREKAEDKMVDSGGIWKETETVRSSADAPLPILLPSTEPQRCGMDLRKVEKEEAVVVVKKKEEEEKEDLRCAREAESRILSSLQRAPQRSLVAQRVFGSAPKMPPSLLISESVGTTSSFLEKEANMFTLGPVAQVEGAGGRTPSEVMQEWSGGAVPYDASGQTTAHDTVGGTRNQCHVAEGGEPVRMAKEDQLSPVRGKEDAEDGQGGEKEKTKTKKVPECGAGWRAVLDPSSGRTYYVNKTTKSTTWKIKETLGVTPSVSTADVGTIKAKEWAEREDSSTGKVYYYNKKTRQTTWKRSETDLDLP